MKPISIIVALFVMAGRLDAADKPAAPADPFAGAFFPPEIVLLTSQQTGLSPEQLSTIRARVEKTQARAGELTRQLERETSALSTMVRQPRVEEAALMAQLDRVLDAEREVKHLHLSLLAWIKNSLTPEQQANLREVTKDGGAGIMEATRLRLTAKVERVQQAAQGWAASGRDPSAVIKAMEEKVKPLLDSGKPLEAEAELDRILDQFKTDGK
jgi:Spy/CpxP family protein refolding chaperone